MIAPFSPSLDGIHNGICDKGAFLLLVKGVIHHNFFPGAVRCPEIFALSLCVMGNNSIGCIQNILSGAVILLQADHFCLMILLLKGENVLYCSASKAINALIVVAHHAEIAAASGQQAGKPILCMVGVLVLIHHHIAKAVLIAGAHLLVFLQQLHRIDNHIVKVHCICIPQQLLIKPVGFANLAQAHIVARIVQIVFWGDEAILCMADLMQERFVGEHFIINVEQPLAFLHHTLRIIRIINRKVAGITNAFPIPAAKCGRRWNERCLPIYPAHPGRALPPAAL